MHSMNFVTIVLKKHQLEGGVIILKRFFQWTVNSTHVPIEGPVEDLHNEKRERKANAGIGFYFGSSDWWLTHSCTLRYSLALGLGGYNFGWIDLMGVRSDDLSGELLVDNFHIGTLFGVRIAFETAKRRLNLILDRLWHGESVSSGIVCKSHCCFCWECYFLGILTPFQFFLSIFLKSESTNINEK